MTQQRDSAECWLCLWGPGHFVPRTIKLVTAISGVVMALACTYTITHWGQEQF